MALPASQLRSAPPPSALAGLVELYEDSPASFAALAELCSRGGRPQFGSIEVCFERGRVTVIKEHRTHK